MEKSELHRLSINKVLKIENKEENKPKNSRTPTQENELQKSKNNVKDQSEIKIYLHKIKIMNPLQ